MARLASFIGLVTVLIINLSLSHGVPARDASYDYQNDADSYNYNDDEEYYNYDTGSNGSNEDIYDASGKKEVVNKRDPTFMVQPKKLMVNEGDIVKLPCVVDIFDAFAILWKKGETVLSVGDQIIDTRVSLEKSSQGNTLVLRLVTGADTGDYTCTVSAANPIFLTHSLTVRERPEVTAVSARVQVKAGEAAELGCEVTRGSPRPEIVWSRQSRPMLSGQETQRGDTLIFPRATRHQAGLYTCSADNGSGKPASAKVQLDVLHKPDVEPEQVFIHTMAGEEVEVVCIIHASPPPSRVEWFKNGELLEPSMNVITQKGIRHSLLIQKIGDTEIHGQYECAAENDFGQARATIEVSGKATPAHFKSPRMGDKKRPTEFRLEWAVSSYTPVTKFRLEVRPDIEGAVGAWRPVEAEVFPTGPATFSGKVMLTELSKETTYLARVAAKNSYGMSAYSDNFQFSTYSDRMAQDAVDAKEAVLKPEKSVSSEVSSSAGRLVLSFPLVALLLSWLLLRR